MRTSVIRSVLPLGAALLLLAGCSDEGGAPSPTNTGQASAPVTQPSSPAQGDTFAGLVACELLTAEEAKQLNAVGPGEDAGEVGGAGTSGCDWQTPYEDGKGATFGLTLRPQQGIADVVVEDGWTKQGAKFAGLEAVVLKKQRETAASCTLVLAVGERSRVDVSANGRGSAEEICDLVADVATIVEPKLPKDGG